MQRVTIIGLGLIGGSIGKALKAAQPEHRLQGVDLPGRLDAARESGLFEALHADGAGAEAVKHADVVFICTPVSRTLELLPDLAEDVPTRAIITDVAGMKRAVVDVAMQAFNFPDAPYFVGGHPMAGKAQYGFAFSDAHLFEGRPWILTPAPHDPVEKLQILEGLITSTGARLHLMTPDEHDRAMAVASQLPQLVSTALMLTAGDRANAVAGPALREMTRLAASPAGLWNELAQLGKRHLIGELHSLKSYLTELEMAVHFGEPLDKWFDRANALRKGLEAS
jgi:prephenate dehydrogenase